MGGRRRQGGLFNAAGPRRIGFPGAFSPSLSLSTVRLVAAYLCTPSFPTTPHPLHRASPSVPVPPSIPFSPTHSNPPASLPPLNLPQVPADGSADLPLLPAPRPPHAHRRGPPLPPLPPGLAGCLHPCDATRHGGYFGGARTFLRGAEPVGGGGRGRERRGGGGKEGREGEARFRIFNQLPTSLFFFTTPWRPTRRPTELFFHLITPRQCRLPSPPPSLPPPTPPSPGGTWTQRPPRNGRWGSCLWMWTETRCTSAWTRRG